MSQQPPPPPPPPPGGQPYGGPPQPPQGGGQVPAPPPPPPPPPGGGFPPPPPPPPPGGGGYPPPPPGGGYPPPPGGGYPPPGGYPGGKPFSVGDAFGYGWKKFTENLGPILIAMLVFLLIGGLIYGLQFVFQSLTGSSTVTQTDTGTVITTNTTSFAGVLVSVIFYIITLVWGYVVQAAYARGGLALSEGRPLQLGDLLSFDRLGRIILAGIILSLLVFVGLLACIIPGLIVAFFGSFFIYFILDQNLAAWDSIKASFAFVKENVGELLLLLILSFLILLAGALLCGIGLFVAMPVTVIAQAYAYKVLRGQPVAP